MLKFRRRFFVVVLCLLCVYQIFAKYSFKCKKFFSPIKNRRPPFGGLDWGPRPQSRYTVHIVRYRWKRGLPSSRRSQRLRLDGKSHYRSRVSIADHLQSYKPFIVIQNHYFTSKNGQVIIMFSIIYLNNNDFISTMESLQSAFIQTDDSCYLNGSVNCNNCGDCL